MPLAGDIIDATDVPGDWSTYTPVLAGATSGGTVGNGTVVGRYIQVGDLVHVMVNLTWGSTTSAGVGAATISLPVTARATSPGMVGCATLLDASAGANGRYSPAGIVFNNTTSVLMIAGAANGVATNIGSLITATVSATWTTSDDWRMSMTYEAA